MDYFVFIVPLLAALGVCGWALWSLGITPSLDNPFVSLGIVIFVLTLPVVLYFALSESSRWQATFGKRLLKVMIVDTSGRRATSRRRQFGQSSSFCLWHWEGFPMNFQIVAMAFAWLVIGWFIISLFVVSRRTPYAWAAGTIVVERTSTLAGTGA